MQFLLRHRWLVVSLVLLKTLASFSVQAQEQPGKKPVQFIICVSNPEDLVEIPGTPWILVSGMKPSMGGSGRIYAIKRGESKQATEIFPASARPARPDRESFPERLGEPDPLLFAPHGINVQDVTRERCQLLVVNHGGRETVEVFDVDLSGETPRLCWRGGISMPPHTSANGVASDDAGEIFATSMFDPSDDYVSKFAKGEATGHVWKWSVKKGWAKAQDVPLSAANGIAVSADGRWLFVSEWAARKVRRYALDGSLKEKIINVDFLPDNIRWTADGKLVIAGQNASPQDLFGCEGREGSPCPQAFTVIEVDPTTMEHRVLLRAGDDRFNGGTGAIRVGQEIWVGSFHGDQVARFPWKEAKTR